MAGRGLRGQGRDGRCGVAARLGHGEHEVPRGLAPLRFAPARINFRGKIEPQDLWVVFFRKWWVG